MLGDWVALQILVKIADDIPGAKLTYRGIKHIIRSYNIELDKDTMDLMCEKILNSVAYLEYVQHLAIHCHRMWSNKC